MLDDVRQYVEKFSESDYSKFGDISNSNPADVNHQNNSLDEKSLIPQQRSVINEPLNSSSIRNYVLKMVSKDCPKAKFTAPLRLTQQTPENAIQNDQTSAMFSTETINQQTFESYLDRQYFTAITTGCTPATGFSTTHRLVSAEKILSLSCISLEPNGCHSGRKGKRVRAKRSSNSSNSQRAPSNNSASTFSGKKICLC